MPNQYIQHYNRILNGCAPMYGFYSGQTLADMGEQFVDIKCLETFQIQLYQLETFRTVTLIGDETDCVERLKSATAQFVAAQKNMRGTCCHLISGTHEGIRVSYASDAQACDLFSAFSRSFPNADTSRECPVQQIIQSALETPRYSGFIANVAGKDIRKFAHVLNAMQRKHFTLCLMGIPVAAESITDELRQFGNLLNDLRAVRQNRRSYGSNTARVFENEDSDTADLIRLLEQKKNFMQRYGEHGLWSMYLYVAADDINTYRTLASACIAANTGSHEDGSVATQPVLLSVRKQLIQAQLITFPYGCVAGPSFGGLWANQFASVVSLNELAEWFTPPTASQPGYQLRLLGQTQGSQTPFAAFVDDVPVSSGQSETLALGQLRFGEPFFLRYEQIRRHVLVAGATQSGKTNTVLCLLNHAQRQGLPFVVIEAAKKDYWRLISSSGYPPLRVYSGRGDAPPLRMNPLIPEEGTLLDFHIQSLVQAFLSTFEKHDPIPQVVTKLLYYCYDVRGWSPREYARRDTTRQYPVIQDMLDHLDTVIHQIRYDPETEQRVSGVIRLRLEMFSFGLLGDVLGCKDSVSFGEYFERSAVIELEDFPDVGKQFLALVLAIKANEYTRRRPMSNKLERLLVIEEAHLILPKRAQQDGVMDVGQYFANMLADVSAFGTGLIVVDQRPDVLHAAAIANTGVKVLHSLREGDAIGTMAQALMLTQVEKEWLGGLKVGQAMVSVPEQTGRYQVQVERMLLNGSETSVWKLFAHGSVPPLPLREMDIPRGYCTVEHCSVREVSSCVDMMEASAMRCYSKDEKLMLANHICCSCMQNPLQIRETMNAYDTMLTGMRRA